MVNTTCQIIPTLQISRRRIAIITGLSCVGFQKKVLAGVFCVRCIYNDGLKLCFRLKSRRSKCLAIYPLINAGLNLKKMFRQQALLMHAVVLCKPFKYIALSMI